MRLEAKIHTIRFRNDENGYSVLTRKMPSGELQTIVGVFPPVHIGQEIVVEGEFIIDPKFGTQFKVANIISLKLSDKDSIQRFLASGVVPGIGDVIAKRIVDAFGSNTFYIIEKDPKKLAQIQGISADKANKISRSYIETKDMQAAVMFLQGLEIGIKLAIKIYAKYGKDTVEMVSKNPYKLVEDIEGVGFLTADRIALGEGFDLNSDFRVRAGVLHILMTSADGEGNTYLPYDACVSKTLELLQGGQTEQVEGCVQSLVLDNKLKLLDNEEIGQCVMHMRHFFAEKEVATRLLSLCETANRMTYEHSFVVEEFEREHGLQLHTKQKDAIEMAVSSGVCVITGGPGTGKTTIIKCILKTLSTLGQNIVLLAPTGRAAKRLAESTGKEASTIHRYLMRQEGDNKVCADVIVVDEVSMVDIFLMRNLLKDIADGTKIVLVGDKDQLPSVGAGNVLGDVLKSGVVPIACLEFVYRQGKQSMIALNAHKINQGKNPDLASTDNDFFYKRCKGAEIAPTLLELVTKRLPKFLDTQASKIQVLAAMKNGPAGTISLNRTLQELINPYKGGQQIIDKEYTFRVGDKVMHIQNNYNLKWTKFGVGVYEEGQGVFNGDMGTIEDIKGSEVTVLFDDGKGATYTNEERGQLVLSYAITIHKSQGSEFEFVVIPIVGGAPTMMTRNLLYTGITRAKKMLVLVGDEGSIERMVKNNYIAMRYSLLWYFLKSGQSAFVLGKTHGDNGVQNASETKR
ncbi:MAG: ATP-dependent RecD-like DNA helicase [Firmicutes bacterium]|nr:ATP-dependent RecD-like DNA helicase [Bacillota bacterium]